MWVPLLAACVAPPEAPEKLDDLMGYLFEHADDDDDAAIDAAAANLDVWLDAHLEDTIEGYEIHDLSEAAIARTGDEVEDMDGLVGAAVGHESVHSAETLGGQNAVPVDTDTSEWGTEGSGRVYESDPACFAAETCSRLQSEEWADEELALGIEAQPHWAQRWRWVELPEGLGLLQTWWILEPIAFSVDFISVEHQFYVWMFLPQADGSSTSVQGTWIAATLTGAPVPDETAMALVVSTMSGTADKLDDRVVD